MLWPAHEENPCGLIFWKVGVNKSQILEFDYWVSIKVSKFGCVYITQAPMNEDMNHEEEGGNIGAGVKMLNKNPTKKFNVGSKYCVTSTIIHIFT